MDSRAISKLIIHCSDSPDDRDIGLADIDRWHKDRGFSGVLVGDHRLYCGYHYVIRRSGDVEIGRPEHYIGAHCKGHNRESIGICWIGRSEITSEQMYALVNICRNLMLRYVLSPDDVYGHCELYSGKTCPNIDMKDLRQSLSQIVLGGRA